MKKLPLRLIAAFLSAFILAPSASYAAELPKSFHATEEDLAAYPATRDQDPSEQGWGACWSFATIALAEFDAVTNLGATKDIDLSEMALVYDTYFPQIDPIGYTFGDTTSFTGEDFLKYGGSMDFGLWTMARGSGLVSEATLPYSLDTFNRIMSGESLRTDPYGNVLRLQSAFTLSRSDVTSVKEQIMAHGAVGMSYYSGSSVDKQGAPYYNEKNNSYYFVKDKEVFDYEDKYEPYANHAVAVVGWDDSFPADSFNVKPEGDGAWLVRNSWTADSSFSKDGYFWLSYYDQGLEDTVYAVSMTKAGQYDNTYQYDGGVFTNSKLTSLDSRISANVFQAVKSTTEDLTAVSIAPTGPCNYSIRIYKGLTDRNNPISGTQVMSVSGAVRYGGFTTIPLGNPVSLSFGEFYSIVVELDGARMSCEYGKSSVYRGDENFGVSVGISAGESFYGTEEGGFADVTTLTNASGVGISALATGKGYGNFRIKAYTRNTGTTGSLSAVEKFTASGIKKDRVKLKWNQVPGAWGYTIYRFDKKTNTYVKLTTLSDHSITGVTIKKLKANTSYKYAISPFMRVGGTIYSGELTEVTFKTRK